MSDPSDKRVAQILAGDTKAAVELVRQHYAAVFAHFRRLCGSEVDAADLTQKTFAKMWVSLASFRGRAPFAGWLYGIAHHVLADWWRRAQPTDTVSDAWWEGCACDRPGPLEQTAQRDLAARLYELVGQLDPDKRETVHLHYFQGLSLSETADALGVAGSTVKYRLREALRFLRTHLLETELRTSHATSRKDL